jgi:glutamine amidotransferase
MQMLASRSEEGLLPGLNWIPGTVQRFSVYNQCKLPLPHMGWNDLILERKDKITRELDVASFYFLHSFVYRSEDPNAVLASSDYGGKFEVVINKNNIYGMQCHPEKSHTFGSQFLKNFSEI